MCIINPNWEGHLLLRAGLIALKGSQSHRKQPSIVTMIHLHISLCKSYYSAIQDCQCSDLCYTNLTEIYIITNSTTAFCLYTFCKMCWKWRKWSGKAQCPGRHVSLKSAWASESLTLHLNWLKAASKPLANTFKDTCPQTQSQGEHTSSCMMLYITLQHVVHGSPTLCLQKAFRQRALAARRGRATGTDSGNFSLLDAKCIMV